MKNLDKQQLLDAWVDAVKNATPHATMRMGDGEACIAAHDEILTMDFVRKMYGWIDNDHYCGVTLPNEKIRKELIEAYHQADVLGLLTQKNWWGFRPLSQMILGYYNIVPKYTCYAFEAFNICKTKQFYEAFQHTKVILVGAKAKKFKDVLERRYGFTGVVGTVDCPNWKYIDEAKQEMDNYDYQLAIIAAGVPAKILAAYAKETGHVGIDVGQGVDVCIGADKFGYYAWEHDGWNAPLPTE